MPDIEEVRRRSEERRRAMMSGSPLRRPLPPPPATGLVVAKDENLARPPGSAETSTDLTLSANYSGPPLSPHLEETLASNPGLRHMIAAANPGVTIPGVSAPPRPAPGPGEPDRPHYQDGKLDVSMLQRDASKQNAAFRPGGIFAPHQGGPNPPGPPRAGGPVTMTPGLAHLIAAVKKTNAAAPAAPAVRQSAAPAVRQSAAPAVRQSAPVGASHGTVQAASARPSAQNAAAQPLEPSQEAKDFLAASMKAWIEGAPLPTVEEAIVTGARVTGPSIVQGEVDAHPSAPVAAPQVQGMPVLGKASAREVMALGSMAVGQVKTVGGVFALQRLDVATYTILGSALEVDASARVGELEAYIVRLEAYVSDLEASYATATKTPAVELAASVVDQACSLIDVDETPAAAPDAKPKNGCEGSDDVQGGDDSSAPHV
jgi:hypothetical protein